MFVKLVLIQALFLAVKGQQTCKPDYYWRDYYGTIPRDAVPAGTDKNGHNIYVGQIYIRNYELLPATIYPDTKKARTTAYGSVLEGNTFVKILCSPFTNAFDWVPTTSSDLHLRDPRYLVSGGSEVGENLWVGRVYRSGEHIVGKIFRDEVSNKGIWFPYNGAPAHDITYELLQYNCTTACEDLANRFWTYLAVD